MMVLADQIPGWKEFPKGLHVMLVDEDLDVINDLKCKLDSCGYSVTSYTKEKEALQALEDKNKIFHVAVVDATRNDTFNGFSVVEAAKHLATIMMASTENMNIMMQGIAAGASEFLQKPLSEERLKNIWQHVVRKALVSEHLVPPTVLGPFARDLKFKATPNPNVSKAALDCRETTDTNQEDGDCLACNADKVDEADDISATQEFVFHDSNSSFMDMDDKDNCEAFLCSTPPQLEQSCTRIMPTDHDDNMERVTTPPLSASQEFDMQTGLKEMQDYFDDCDDYLHIKSEVDEAVNNSVILNDLFDSKPQMESENFLLMCDDHQDIGNEDFVDAKLCADLELDDIPDSLDITLGSDILDDTTDQSLSMGLGCLDDEEFPEADDEALLLTEVVKIEESMVADLQCNARSLNDSICNDNGHNMHQSSSTATSGCPNSESRGSEAQEEMKSRSDSEQSCSTKGSKASHGKKKTKVDWTPELHRRFVQAVEQLGLDKAIPSRILELMGVKCLTRHNIASHLQKYRSHRKHVQAREVDAVNWNQRRHMHMEATTGAAHGGHTASPLHSQRPLVRPTSIHRPAALALAAPALHVWGHPTLDPSLHFWPAWPPPGCQLDAWGNPFYPAQPILRLPLAPMPSAVNLAWSPPTAGKAQAIHPPKETVVAAINEVLRNPFVPLPLGLKSPSLESVVCELHRQGISTPPTATA